MKLDTILRLSIEQDASDIFIISGAPIAMRINGEVKVVGDRALTPEDTKEFIRQIYKMTNSSTAEKFLSTGDDDFSFSVAGIGRFRVNAYLQRGSQSAVLRVVKFELPSASEMNIPDTVIGMSKFTNGLVLVTGQAGSGKSTTLSCIIDKINRTRNSHIITLEDPIEFLHKHKSSIVSQREVQSDTRDYIKALRSALRQSPDVILLGEMRDFETMSIAMTAAETGQLVLSTLHTIGAAKTIDRIIDVFPPNQQHQIRVQLSMVLRAVISQQLIPDIDGQLIPVFEIMIVNDALRNMIRESKVHQIDTVIFTGGAKGMRTMDSSILELYESGRITKDTAFRYCTNIDYMKRKIEN